MPRIGHTTIAQFFPGREKAVPPCVYVKYDNGDIVLSYDFAHRRTQPLEVHKFVDSEEKWVREKRLDNLTEFMWNYHRKQQRKSRTSADCRQLMKHERAKKKGGAGKMSHDQTVTDYECTNNPLHDFRRSMCVQWNNGI